MPFSHIIKFHEANRRLDHFLMHQSYVAHTAFTSRSECTRTIHQGLVLVNNASSKPSYVLKTGDVVLFTDTSPSPSQQLIPNKDIPITLLFQNEHFAILDKPAGVAMHPSNARDDNATVAHWLIATYPHISTVGEDALRPGIVHRLDKNTSGLCIIAKTQASFLALKKLFQDHAITKTYTALVHGHIMPREGTITTAIARSLTLKKQAVVDSDLKVRGKIRSAITNYSVLHSYTDFDLIEALPKTGRMHQIRVHLFSKGHPLVGDATYHTKITRKADKAYSPALLRHLLHAKRLEFNLFGIDYDFSSPLPDDFQEYIDVIAHT